MEKKVPAKATKKPAVATQEKTELDHDHEGRQPVRLTRAEQVALAIQVSLSNKQIPTSTAERQIDESDRIVQAAFVGGNPLLTNEIVTSLVGKKCLDEKGEPTRLGIALILRNLSQGTNFEKFVGRLNRSAKMSLLFVLAAALTKEVGEAGIHYNNQNGEENPFWNQFADVLDQLDLLLEAKPR